MSDSKTRPTWLALVRRRPGPISMAARKAAQLVVERGCHRGRDLAGEVEQLLAGSS